MLQWRKNTNNLELLKLHVGKGKKVSEEDEVVPSKELEPQKGAKITKGAQRKTSVEGKGAEVVAEHRPSVPTWNPPLELDGVPLPLDSSIRDFQKGKADYVANTLKQPLLLPQDMADLRTLKKHEVFLTLKRDLAMVCTLVYFLYHIYVYSFHYCSYVHILLFFQKIHFAAFF